MDLSCLSFYPPLPAVPKTSNDSNTLIPPKYEPNGGDIFQMISTALASSTFSTNDIHSLLNKVFNKSSNSWDMSEIIKTQPIPSIIIYSSIALAVFLIFSIMFCVISCCNSKKYQRGKKRSSRTTKICVCLLIIVYLLGIGDMIYVAYRINNSKLSIDNTIKEINRDVYPKEISEHMEYLNKQINRLDQYCVESNSIFINASKSIIVQAFDDVLKEKYFAQDIVLAVNNTDQYIRELDDEIAKQPTIPQSAVEIFDEFQEQEKSMVIYIEISLKEVCKYANGTDTDTDKKLSEALNIVHVLLKKLIDTINQDVLKKITPWQDHMLMDKDTEEQIRGYISLIGTIFFILVIVLGGIPLIFFVFILISRLCSCTQNESNEDNFNDRIPMANVSDTLSDEYYPDNNHHYRHNTRNKVTPVNHHGQRSRLRKINSNNSSSGVTLCLMRIAFAIMIILFIVLLLLTGVCYALDLAVQGSCRTIHDDQPFLVNMLSDKLIKSNFTFGNSSEMNTTVMNIIHDCRDQVHFSRKLLESYWSNFDNDVNVMMNILSQKIYDQFIIAISRVNISSDINLLDQFVVQANVSTIPALVKQIDTELFKIEGYFQKINSSNSTLPQSLVQTTIDQFKNYVYKVLESTMDACPLPMTTVYKTDILVCHTMGDSVNGLWLSVFFFMCLITVGLCIFGVCVYKRLISSFNLILPTVNRF